MNPIVEQIATLSGPQMVAAWNKLTGERVKRFQDRKFGARKLASIAKTKSLGIGDVFKAAGVNGNGAAGDHFDILAMCKRTPGDAKHDFSHAMSIMATKQEGGAVSKTPATPKSSAKPKRSREGDTKLEQLAAMLKRQSGTTMREIIKTFGWQTHSARAAISAGVGKKMGLTIKSEKIANGDRRYWIG